MATTGFKRPSLRAALRQELKNRILQGRITADARIGEADLAEDLGVSRTPLREALIALEHDGLIACAPGRGFSVIPLTIKECRETYPVVGAFESIALKSSSRLAPAVYARMEQLNVRLSRDSCPLEEGLDLDTQWHATLLLGCDNQKLMAFIRQAKEQLERYEYAYGSARGTAATSASDHDSILEALRHGHTERAARLLDEHWISGARRMSDWLDGGESSSQR